MDRNYIFYGTFAFCLLSIFGLIYLIKDVISASVPNKQEKELYNSDIQNSSDIDFDKNDEKGE